MPSELKKTGRYAVFFSMATHKLKEHIQTLYKKPGHENVRYTLCNILKENLGAKEDEIALEKRLTCRGRIDALWKHTIFEIKRDLSKEHESAKSQLKQYIQSKETETKEKYVGIATDGKDYLAYCLLHEKLKEISKFSLNQEKVDEFIRWLESVILIKDQLKATPEIICKEIGQESPLCRNSLLQIKYLYQQAKVRPDVRLKYNLWKKSVDIVYGKEGAEESLFIEHTYLTIISKAMAYVAFFDSLPSLGGDQLLNGKKFKEAGVHGIVEDDFFSWIVYCNAGKQLIRNIASHVHRFDFSTIRSDILKGLYEGLIRQEQRHKIGEYYTPDWLAEKVCKEAIKKPLSQRVIDPACGSGAFLFHSIKLLIYKAKEQNMSSKETIKLICEKIAGIDIHPVAVIFSRITYLLALLKEIKEGRPDTVEVPVYLGDSLQWQKENFLGRYELRITVPEDKITGAKRRQLVFPGSICQDSEKFNKVLRQMINMAGKLKEPSAFKAYSQNQSLNDSEKKTLLQTYTDLLELQKEDRNHIWGYVARNLTRPIWLSSEKQKADVVVGNPPWLRLNAMNPDMQKKFKKECESTGLWDNKDQNKASNSKFRTSQDICTYFFIISAQLYMKEKGTLAFVLPYGVMNGEHHAKFRKGSFGIPGNDMNLKFEKAWAFDHKVKNLFKVPSCVLFSKRNKTKSEEPLPDNIIQFKGKLPEKNCRWLKAQKHLSASKAKWPIDNFDKPSDYYEKFKQGASLVPRRFCFVKNVQAGKLGSSTKTPLVRGITSNLDKVPWKDIEPPQANIESRFLMPVYTGQSIAPFKVLSKNTGIIPWDNQSGVMDSAMAERRGYTHLSTYLEKVEKLWDDHGKGTMSFKNRINYQKLLDNQFPISELRVVYTASGTYVAAVLLEDPKGIIDTSLYWTTVKNQDEGLYLEGILNSDSLVEKISALQAQGQWGARHFSRHLLKPYFPMFNPKDPLHKEIVSHARTVKLIAQNVELDSSWGFVRARQTIKKEIKGISQGKVWQSLNRLVNQLLDKANISQTAS